VKLEITSAPVTGSLNCIITDMSSANSTFSTVGACISAIHLSALTITSSVLPPQLISSRFSVPSAMLESVLKRITLADDIFAKAIFMADTASFEAL